MRFLTITFRQRLLFLIVALSGTIASSQDDRPVKARKPIADEWHRSLVKIDGENQQSAMTGVIVKADEKSILILTTREYRGEQNKEFGAEESLVTVTTTDGQSRGLKGKLSNYLGFSPLYMETGRTGYLAVVEAKHEGLKLTPVKLGDAAPKKDTAARAVMSYWEEENDAPVVQNVTVSNDLNPATCNPLLGKITGSDWSQQGLLTVHDTDGTLIGVAQSGGVQLGGFGGGQGMGGGGFGGGSGGGFFSIPDPRAQSENVVLPALTFVAVADYASQLSKLGVPVSDELLNLQPQRRRIYNDSFGRPIQSKNIQITWSDDHQELHGFSTTRGEWSKLKIDERDIIIPIVGDGVAAVSLNGSIAAYSGEKGVWDVVNLRPGSQVPPSVSNDIVTVRDGKNYYTFAASSGVWTSPTDVNYQKHEEIVEFDGNWAELNRLMRQAGNRASVQNRGALGGVAVTGIRHHVSMAMQIMNSLQADAKGHGGDKGSNPNVPEALRLLMNKESELTKSGGYSHPSTIRVRGQVEAMINAAPNALALLLHREAEMSNSFGPSHPERVKIRKEIEARIPKRKEATPGHPDLLLVPTAAEVGSLKLAAELRATDDHDPLQVDELRSLVETSFEERLVKQKNMAERLESKLQQVRKAIQVREANRNRIIERRVEELLDPEIDWSKLEPNQDTGNSDVQVADVPVDLSGVVMLEFTASYCQPCQQMIPVMQRMKRDGFPIQTIDITAQPEVSRRHNVDRIPTLIVMVRGKEVERLVGVQSDAKLRRIMNNAARKLEEAALSQAKQAIKSVGRTAKGSLDRTTVGKQVAIRFTLPRDVPLMHDHPRIDSLSLIPSDGTVEIDASGTATQLAKLYRQILNDLDDSDEVVASFAVPTGKLKPIEGEGIHAAVTGFGYRGTKAELAFFDEFLNWVAPRLNDSTTTPDDFANKSLEIQRRQGRLPGAGMPATETPVGLPGPPHVPTGGPGVRSPEARQRTRSSVTSTNIVDDLNERRRFAVTLCADRIVIEQKTLSQWRKSLDDIRREVNDPEIDDAHRDRVVSSTTSRIQTLQEEFGNWMSRWKNSWRNYESQVFNMERDVQDATAKLKLATAELNRKKELHKRSICSAAEVLRAETDHQLVKSELQRAERRLDELRKIAEDSPDLNPNNFDVESLLVDPEKESKPENPGQNV